MANSKEQRKTQRRFLDTKLSNAFRAGTLSLAPPRAGWLRSIREALGISSRLLAKRLGIDMSAVLRLEEREKQKKVSLETLERAARAMDCRLVYAIVPVNDEESLDDILERRSLRVAEKIIEEVDHSMRLEKQSISDQENYVQLKRLAFELKEKLDARLWKDL